MKIHIEVDEATLRRLVCEYLQEQFGTAQFNPVDVRIEVKSKQNWKAEWEKADFRAVVHKEE